MPFMKQNLAGLEAYKAPYITTGIKLDANENTHPIPQALRDHMREWVDSMLISLYPDTNSIALCEALARNYEVPSDWVVCGVGSDQLIDYLLRAVLKEGDKVLAPGPSFSMYRQSTFINGGQLIEVPLASDFSYDVPAFLEGIRKEQPQLIFICNPNNPTGCALTNEEMERIVTSTSALVIIDEAYGEFLGETAIPLVKKYSNLIVLKTFSKAYSLAGARVGYGVAQAPLITMINKIRPPFNLNIFAQEVALWVITHQEAFAPSIAAIVSERERLIKALKELGLTVYNSKANFLWVETPLALDEILTKEEIFIKKMGYNGKPYFRISIGTPKENTLLINVLKKEARVCAQQA
ncbi:histidinol-phosphate transaminase [Sporanaerobium hydrogeniformans]|uniref:Histidinol-phosphate transaminase n=1 Tax=Sporanaerobium hydrogeniformans TaxID=3072179 RepID=A0AC61DED7_9FIRM|nr:histidinol-phosphate transaminase [Sporanaerobium hydrogeniformans]PHV71017.1 histidinol-phosphate transaminase [Sporanaerobium hydrogeniformans]